MSIQVHINRYARIKLTAHGEAVLERALAGLGTGDCHMCDGRVQMPIWEMLRIFGPHMYPGAQAVFENNTFEIFASVTGEVSAYPDDPAELGWYGA